MSGKNATTDAVELLRRRYVDGDPDRLASLRDERLDAKVAGQIHALPKQAGLSQAELAERIGTTQSAVGRLEDADYEGHSLSMLRRVAKALGTSVDVDLGEAGRNVTLD